MGLHVMEYLSPQEQVERELSRLRGEVETRAGASDTLAVAIIEALASSSVQELLLPILENDAVLKKALVDPVVTMAGIAQVNFECEWKPDVSHMGVPPLVAALIQITPPRVLHVQKVAYELRKAALTTSIPLTPPASETPPSLKNINQTARSDAELLNESLNQSFAKWAEVSGLGPKLTALRTGQVITTNTSCSTLFCFEDYSDDYIQDTQ